MTQEALILEAMQRAGVDHEGATRKLPNKDKETAWENLEEEKARKLTARLRDVFGKSRVRRSSTPMGMTVVLRYSPK